MESKAYTLPGRGGKVNENFFLDLNRLGGFVTAVEVHETDLEWINVYAQIPGEDLYNIQMVESASTRFRRTYQGYEKHE